MWSSMYGHTFYRSCFRGPWRHRYAGESQEKRPLDSDSPQCHRRWSLVSCCPMQTRFNYRRMLRSPKPVSGSTTVRAIMLWSSHPTGLTAPRVHCTVGADGGRTASWSGHRRQGERGQSPTGYLLVDAGLQHVVVNL